MSNGILRDRRVFIAVMALLLAAACSGAGGSGEWATLPPAPAPEQLDQLAPVWDNERANAALDVRIYLEVYCREPACLDYLRESAPALIAAPDARVRIYDYPLSQTGKSFLFAGVGRCVALKNPDAYLEFLRLAIDLPDRYDNNVEMQRISKSAIGEYNTRCIHAETRKLQAAFENRNPLGFSQTPATIIQGRLIYGARPAQAWAALLQQAREN